MVQPDGGIRIHHALERNLRALTAEERAELERSILAEGCRDPIVVWAEENAIIDGHNRFRICEEHGIAYSTVRVSLPSLEEALAWQVRNQVAKRNLSPQETAYYRGKDYLASKKTHGGDRKSESGGSSGHFVHMKTGEEVAERHGVGEKTVRRDAAFADAVDALADALADALGEEVRTRILTNDLPLSKQDVVTLAHAVADEPDIGETAARLLLGEEPNDLRGLNPHGVRSAEIAILLARIREECGEFTYLQLFEQVETVDTPLVRHDRAQLEYMLNLAREGNPDPYTADLVAGVGLRYKLLRSIAQLAYLIHLGEVRGLSDEDAAEMVRRAQEEEGMNIYAAALRMGVA